LWRHNAWDYGQTPGKFNNNYSGGNPFVYVVVEKQNIFKENGYMVDIPCSSFPNILGN
jgi:hypothetical protein